MQRRRSAGSFIGSLAESREQLARLGKKGITAVVEPITMAEVNDAYPRITSGEVRYHSVIDRANSPDLDAGRLGLDGGRSSCSHRGEHGTEPTPPRRSRRTATPRPRHQRGRGRVERERDVAECRQHRTAHAKRLPPVGAGGVNPPTTYRSVRRSAFTLVIARRTLLSES